MNFAFITKMGSLNGYQDFKPTALVSCFRQEEILYHTTYEIDHKSLGKEDIDTYLVRVCTTYSTYDTQGRVKLLQWASAVSIMEG